MCWAGRRHVADRCDLARFGRRVAFIIGTGWARSPACSARSPFCTPRSGCSAGDLPRRALWRGGAILSLRRRRRRQRRLPAQGGVLGDGGRRVRRRARSAARAMDHGHLAALSVRLQLRGAGRGRAGRDGDSRGRRRAEACGGRSAWRPPAVRDRAAAALHRRSTVRRHRLSHDEPGHDLGAARHEDVRAECQRFQFRHSVAHRGDVRAELLHGRADRALRRAEHRRARPGAGSGRRRPSVCPASPRCISGRR